MWWSFEMTEATFLKVFFPLSTRVCFPLCLSICHSWQFLADLSSPRYTKDLKKEGGSVRSLYSTKSSFLLTKYGQEMSVILQSRTNRRIPTPRTLLMLVARKKQFLISTLPSSLGWVLLLDHWRGGNSSRSITGSVVAGHLCWVFGGLKGTFYLVQIFLYYMPFVGGINCISPHSWVTKGESLGDGLWDGEISLQLLWATGNKAACRFLNLNPIVLPTPMTHFKTLRFPS